MAVSGVTASPTTALEPEDTRSAGCQALDALAPFEVLDRWQFWVSQFPVVVGETISVQVTAVDQATRELRAILDLRRGNLDFGDIPGTLSAVVSADTVSAGLVDIVFFSISDEDPVTATLDWSCEAPTPPPPPVDTDGDGVPDNVDACPGTVADAAAVRQNRFRMNSEGNFVDSVGTIAATVADTRGCSAAQIIAAAGLGNGHTNFGITRSALDDWIAPPR
jgi:hypothetical protein